MKIIHYGIFGTEEIQIDDDGFIEIPVIVQESGLFSGAPPAALRIHSIGVFHEDKFNKQYVAKLNEHTDLPFYLTTAKVKIVSPLVKWTNTELLRDGIEPLKR